MSALRDIIEQASEHAEVMFDPQKVMMARHLCFAADGSLSIYVCPLEGNQTEIMFRELLPKTFARKFVRWVFVTEAWSAEGKPGDPLPAKHPHRIEIIAFHATEGATGETLTAKRQIYRPAVGGGRLLPLVYETKRKALFMMGRDE